MSDERKILPRLSVEHGSEGRSIDLSASPFTLGRASECHLRVDDKRISRFHAEIICEAEKCFLADLDSRNGTFLNGERLSRERRPLKDGDEIRLGTRLILRFEDPNTTSTDVSSPILSRGLHLDLDRREVFVQYQKLEPRLPQKVFKLVEILVKHQGEIVSKDQIARHVWPESKGGVTDQMIDTLVTRLRKRLSEVDNRHEYIERIRGSGLRLVQR